MPDFPPIVVTFARPEESRGLRRRLAEREKLRRGEHLADVGMAGGVRLAVVHTGIGPEAAERALNELGDWSGVRQVIGAGFAGALAPELAMGDVVVDARLVNERRRIVSRALPVETVEAKAALYGETRAQAVDMETETMGAWCERRGMAFTAVRAVSDTAAQALPVPFAVWFDVRRQRARVCRLLGWLVTHPVRVAPFFRFVRRLSMVSERLAEGVEGELRKRDWRSGG